MKPIQLDIEEAINLRDGGIKQAIDHAEAVEPSWGDIAYGFLMNLKPKGVWMMEDIRKAAEGIVPDPPDSRAWGAVVRKAARDGIIEKVGVQSKASAICHRGFASLWQFKPLLSLLFAVVLLGCQKSTYIVFKQSEYSADTIKIGIGLVVFNYENKPPELALDTAYLRKFIKRIP